MPPRTLWQEYFREAVVRMTDIRENVILKQYTTFKAGGPADLFAEPGSVEEIRELIGKAEEDGIPYLVLGAGSNVLISDKGYRGLVIRLGRPFSGIEAEDDGDHMILTSLAGTPLALLGNRATQEGLEGAEFCCGIPGSVGGAVYMNAGAYGGEIKDIATEVTYLKDGKTLTVPAGACDFGYRQSIFARDDMTDAVILSLKIRLPKGDKEAVATRVAELKQKRCASQPVDVPSAGSTFKRPTGYYAGTLIQENGLKGFALDDSGAQVSPKHAGFVVNNGGTASATDIKRLIDYVSDTVYEKNGVRLRPEVRLIGEWD